MAIFKNNPPIVTNGLVLYLDAANRQSYVSGSTIWKDLSGNSNSGSLINGPTFSNNNGGSVVFDGVNDRASLSSNYILSSTSDWTLQTWIQSNQTSSISSYLRLLNKGTDSVTNWLFLEWNNRILAFNSSGSAFAFQSGWSPGLPLDKSTFLLTLIGRSGILELYSNITKTTVNTPLTGSLVFNNLMVANNVYSPGGSISSFLLYNRALSSEEILQNYNATKTRFNLT